MRTPPHRKPKSSDSLFTDLQVKNILTLPIGQVPDKDILDLMHEVSSKTHLDRADVYLSNGFATNEDKTNWMRMTDQKLCRFSMDLLPKQIDVLVLRFARCWEETLYMIEHFKDTEANEVELYWKDTTPNPIIPMDFFSMKVYDLIHICTKVPFSPEQQARLNMLKEAYPDAKIEVNTPAG